MASQTYEEIPKILRDVLDEVYLREGVVIWWNNRHALLGESARERWEKAAGDVMQLAYQLRDGAFA